jgi:tetratricopeptide (TPR) repeat protein
MALKRMTTWCIPWTNLFSALVVSALTILGLGQGCSEGTFDAEKDLDSTLARVESMVGSGKVLEARRQLLNNLNSTPGGWNGKGAATAYRLLGDLSKQTAQLDSAMAFYGQAEEHYRGLAQRQDAFHMSLAIADIYRLMQQNDEARRRTVDVLRLAALLGDSAAVAEIRWTLLGFSRDPDNPMETERIAENLRNSCVQSKDLRGEARIAYLLGEGKSWSHAPEEGLADLRESVSLSEKAGDSVLTVHALLALGRTLERTGRIREAQQCFTTVLEQSALLTQKPALEFQVLMCTGNFFLRNQRSDIAASYFERAVDKANGISHALGEAYAHLQRGHCVESGNSSQAASLYRLGFDILQRTGYARGKAYALLSMGRIAEQRNETTDALQLYGAAVKAQESAYAVREPGDLWLDCEEAALGRGNADGYGALISLHLQKGNTDDAFTYQDRRSARSLSDDLSRWDLKSGSSSTDAMLASYTHLRALHAGAESVIAQLASGPDSQPALIAEVTMELERVQEKINLEAERIRHADSRFAMLVRADGISLADVQHALGNDVTLLVYLPTARSMFVCAVTQTRSTVQMAAVTQERVVALSGEYLAECARQSAMADSNKMRFTGQELRVQEVTRGLYEALVLPVEPVLRPGTRILVVLPASLPALPLGGLRRGGGTASQAFGDRYTLSYLPSSRFALSTTTPPGTIRTVTALGVRGSTSWDVEYELRDIHAFYRDAIMFFGKDASFAPLHAMHTDLLHLSVEIRNTSQHPLAGHIILGDGVSVDGTQPVSFGAIFSLPSVPVVVISNLSARAPSMDRGVAAAFLANGAASVVANATPMTRKAKKVFGEGFYTALQGGASVPMALRSAQTMMSRTKDLMSPCLWAPIMHWGVGGKEPSQK